MDTIPEALLEAVASSPVAAGVLFGLWLVARVLDRQGTLLATAVDNHAAAIARVASALRERERRPPTMSADEHRTRRGSKKYDVPDRDG